MTNQEDEEEYTNLLRLAITNIHECNMAAIYIKDGELTQKENYREDQKNKDDLEIIITQMSSFHDRPKILSDIKASLKALTQSIRDHRQSRKRTH